MKTSVSGCGGPSSSSAWAAPLTQRTTRVPSAGAPAQARIQPPVATAVAMSSHRCRSATLPTGQARTPCSGPSSQPTSPPGRRVGGESCDGPAAAATASHALDTRTAAHPAPPTTAGTGERGRVARPALGGRARTPGSAVVAMPVHRPPGRQAVRQRVVGRVLGSCWGTVRGAHGSTTTARRRPQARARACADAPSPAPARPGRPGRRRPRRDRRFRRRRLPAAGRCEARRLRGRRAPALRARGRGNGRAGGGAAPREGPAPHRGRAVRRAAGAALGRAARAVPSRPPRRAAEPPARGRPAGRRRRTLRRRPGREGGAGDPRRGRQRLASRTWSAT